MDAKVLNNEGAPIFDDGWIFSLEPKDAVVPRYEADVLDANQPRAVRANRRHQKKHHEQQYRHFWLPDRNQSVVKVEDHPQSSDSEDDAPRRDRLISRVQDGGDIAREEVEDTQAPSLVVQHQILEKANPHVSPHTCSYCRQVSVDLRRQRAYQFLPGDRQRPKGWRVQPSWTGFTHGDALAAAGDGCLFFAFVTRILRIPGSSTADDHGFEITMTGMVHGVATLGLSIQRSYQGRTPQRHNPTQSLSLYTVPGTKPLHETIGSYLPPNLLPDSQLSFTRARRWLETCDNDHPGCRAHAVSRPYMPKRVLEIDSTSPILRARLSTHAPLAPYAALSYCWGGDQAAKTVKSRLAEYANDIPLHTLPRTIQDALVVTRGIGLRYLWVDAMCIVQDDGDDMADQIGQMYAVYRSAYVTISAATAATSQEGFLHPRTSFRGFTLSARLSSNVFGHVLAVPEPKAALRSGASTAGHTHDYPLFTRGWTYQEHQLSPRILIYGTCGMLYWCPSSSHRDGGNEHPGWQEQNEYAALLFYQAQLGTSNAAFSHPRSWGDVVENYSQRKLTVESDKLPAVAAVAERYVELAERESMPVGDYLAGMWRGELLLQCLWRVWDPTKARHPKASYRAPSWSWAALEGDVYPWSSPGEDGGEDPLGMRVTCELIHAETTLCSARIRFGSVSAGFMRIRAKMRRVLWFNYDEHRNGRYQALNLRHGRDPSASDDELALLMQGGGTDPRLTIGIDVAGDWAANEEIVLWSAEVYSACSSETNVEVEGEGLLLHEVTDGALAGVDTFRRVGRISVCSQEYMREPYWFNERESEWREITIV
ncbi:heterokaryon incompatibility protein-domain-containing protein [Cercophora newfieldiana]|uniref:Heterokaryon incompatibility protein-domain-containing protein n=1 Tax=Cercophora newfieldiana TaxID=92897 RepID=A0AA39Y8Z6_9PEZI|nr:heterokaryon incompatibility protein-domain-containing protein [Cercophora newfieldiana]